MRIRTVIVTVSFMVLSGVVLYLTFLSSKSTGYEPFYEPFNDKGETASNTGSSGAKEITPEISPQEAERIIKETALQVIKLIKDKDFESLSRYVHPEKGVRFSENGVDTKEDVVFTAEQIKGFFNDDKIYTWSYDAGTGDPVKGTPREHYNGIYSHDFANAKKIGYNKFFHGSYYRLEAYPHAIIVEFYVPGTDPNPEFAGFKWGSLQLVFEVKDDQWYLVGIINGFWII